MHRTQIYLTDREVELLEREAERTGASRSELIRRAIRAEYGSGDIEAKLKALDESFGAWKDRDFTGAEYVEARRRGSRERRRRLGLDQA